MSGKSVKAYCASSGFTPATFQYWRRKLGSASDPIVFEVVLCTVHVEGYRAVHIRFLSGVEMWLEGDDKAAFLRMVYIPGHADPPFHSMLTPYSGTC